MSTVNDFHDSFCSCWHGFAHMLDLIFPEGHKDRDKTIKEIIDRDIQCLSGGHEEEDHGMAEEITLRGDAATHAAAAEEDFPEEDIDALVTAVEHAEKR